MSSLTARAGFMGARLAYVVVQMQGKVKRNVTRYTKEKGLFTEEQEQDAGYMVYFPRGHAIRIPDMDRLKRYNLDKKPRIINLQGLSDPNSTIGQLMMSQDQDDRAKAMDVLENHVIQLATADSGPILMQEQAVQHSSLRERAAQAVQLARELGTTIYGDTDDEPEPVVKKVTPKSGEILSKEPTLPNKRFGGRTGR